MPFLNHVYHRLAGDVPSIQPSCRSFVIDKIKVEVPASKCLVPSEMPFGCPVMQVELQLQPIRAQGGKCLIVTYILGFN
jgi:hypothetical protein